MLAARLNNSERIEESVSLMECTLFLKKIVRKSVINSRSVLGSSLKDGLLRVSEIKLMQAVSSKKWHE
jgi:hypothetical protein